MDNSRYKFRGWDTRKNVMYSAEKMGEDQLTLSVDGCGFINVNSRSTKLSTFPTHIIPLQYTGLKDKEGVEAGQSDKIRVSDGDGFAIGEVVWHRKKGQWYWMAREIDRQCLTVYIGRGIPLWEVLDEQTRFKGVIIGNVYESLELLTEKSHV